MTKLMFMDGWDFVEQFGRLTKEFFEKLDLTDDRAVEDCIREKGITVDKQGSTVLISFTLDADRMLSDGSEKSEENTAKVSGKMELEKETWNVLHFEYDFGPYLLEEIKKTGEGKSYFNASVDDFTIQGQFLNKQISTPFLGQQFEEYGEENKYDFINGFTDHSIPFYEEEG